MHPGQAARSGNVMGVDEGQLASEVARKLSVSGGARELSLKGVGLREVPPDVWDAAHAISVLDLSNNPVSTSVRVGQQCQGSVAQGCGAAEGAS